MKQISLTYRSFPKEQSIELPYSKSIVARQLLLAYMQNKPLPPLPEAEEAFALCNQDILLIWHAVHRLRQRAEGETVQLDCGSSATAMRFLMIAAIYERFETFLVGSPQLMTRIEQDDLSFLHLMGAECRLYDSGVAIIPHMPVTKVHLTTEWKSSQYCSAILICNKALGNQVTFDFPDQAPSYSYLKLTKELLEQEYPAPLERDWSAATFWYQLSMSYPDALDMQFPGLQQKSLQPDAKIKRDGLMMGTTTQQIGEKLLITSVPSHLRMGVDTIYIDQHLDSFLPLTLTYIRNHKPFRIIGTRNLRYKESNRIASFIEAMEWYNVGGFSITDDEIIWDGTWGKLPEMVMINPHGDHRVAMAFAVFAVTLPGVTTVLLDPDCIAKSYPRFLDHLLGN